MYKKILVGALAAIVVTAISFSVYNVLAKGQNTTAIKPLVTQNPNGNGASVNSQVDPVQNQGNTEQRSVQGQQSGQSGNGQARVASNPQNGMTDRVTLQGVVSNYAAPDLTLTTADGADIPVQLGNLNYLNTVGLDLKEGDSVTITGFYDASGALVVASLTIDATGQTFTLRDEMGRPAWRGGRGNGQGNGNGGGGQGKGGGNNGGYGNGTTSNG